MVGDYVVYGGEEYEQQAEDDGAGRGNGAHLVVEEADLRRPSVRRPLPPPQGPETLAAARRPAARVCARRASHGRPPTCFFRMYSLLFQNV